MKQRKKGHNEKRKSDEAEDTPERERGHLGEVHLHSLSERHVGKENKINRATFCIRLFGVIFGLREIDNTIYSLHRARIEMYTKYALLYTKCSIRDLFHRSPPSHWAPRCSRNPPRSIISHISESSLQRTVSLPISRSPYTCPIDRGYLLPKASSLFLSSLSVEGG